MKTKYVVMIFDRDNILKGFTEFLFNTKKQALKYIRLLPKETKKNKIFIIPIKVLDSKGVNQRVKDHSKIVGR